MIEFERNPALEEELYARLRLKYVQDRTGEIHFSDTLYCLTKAYFNKIDPIPVDNDTLGLFAVGFALEDVLLKATPTVRDLEDITYDVPHPYQDGGDDLYPTEVAEAIHAKLTQPVVKPYTYEGLHFSPDYKMTAMVGEMDLKTTRMWSEEDGRPKITDDRPHGFPETWLKQFMGYAHRIGATPADIWTPVDYVDYSVAVFYVSQAKLIAGTIRFAWDEVEENMAYHLHRAAILEDQLAKQEVPTPFMYNDQWECAVGKPNPCPYFSRCKGWQG